MHTTTASVPEISVSLVLVCGTLYHPISNRTWTTGILRNPYLTCLQYEQPINRITQCWGRYGFNPACIFQGITEMTYAQSTLWLIVFMHLRSLLTYIRLCAVYTGAVWRGIHWVMLWRTVRGGRPVCWRVGAVPVVSDSGTSRKSCLPAWCSISQWLKSIVQCRYHFKGIFTITLSPTLSVNDRFYAAISLYLKLPNTVTLLR